MWNELFCHIQMMVHRISSDANMDKDQSEVHTCMSILHELSAKTDILNVIEW